MRYMRDKGYMLITRTKEKNDIYVLQEFRIRHYEDKYEARNRYESFYSALENEDGGNEEAHIIIKGCTELTIVIEIYCYSFKTIEEAKQRETIIKDLYKKRKWEFDECFQVEGMYLTKDIVMMNPWKTEGVAEETQKFVDIILEMYL